MPLQSSSVSIDAMSNQTKIWAFILGPILAVIVYYLMPKSFTHTMRTKMLDFQIIL